MMKICKKDTEEYKALDYVVSYLNMKASFSNENYFYKIEDIFLDFPSTMWTTIVAYGKHEYQILTPFQHKQILEATSTKQLDLIGNMLWYERL